MATMQNLVTPWVLSFLISFTCAFPNNFKSDGTTLSCSNGLVPLFTNGNFILFCCHDNEK